MWRIYFTFLLCFFALLFSLQVWAQPEETTTTTTERIIVTPAPAPKEVVVVPSGYTSCFSVPAGWYKGVWVPAHQVCRYTSSSEGEAWIEGYWSCDKYNETNDCTNWSWVAGHWEKTLPVY
jgi:hypothetical protein